MGKFKLIFVLNMNMPKNNPVGFRNVSIREELYQDIQRFMQENMDELRMKRIRNSSQFVDASVRCFIACRTTVIERRI